MDSSLRLEAEKLISLSSAKIISFRRSRRHRTLIKPLLAKTVLNRAKAVYALEEEKRINSIDTTNPYRQKRKTIYEEESDSSIPIKSLRLEYSNLRINSTIYPMQESTTSLKKEDSTKEEDHVKPLKKSISYPLHRCINRIRRKYSRLSQAAKKKFYKNS